jgi:hypothetical protein
MFKLNLPAAGLLAVCLAIVPTPVKPAGQTDQPGKVRLPANHRVSVKRLDLSHAPATRELMATGQLGGLPFPTCALKHQKRQDAPHVDCGKPIEEWNRHEYLKSVAQFCQHVADFQDSPWGAETEQHVGCNATYNGRCTEAEAIFRKLIAEHQGKDHDGARMMLGKARQRLGLLKVEQHNLEEAGVLFAALLESPDWRHRTYASHWIQRLSRNKVAREALLSCGVDALAYALERMARSPGFSRSRAPVPSEGGTTNQATHIRTRLPMTPRGHSLQSLVNLATEHCYERQPQTIRRFPVA